MPPIPAEVASTALLGSAREELAGRLDEMWASAVQGPWAERYETMERGARRLARFDAEGGPPTDNAARALELGLLMEEVRGRAAALSYMRAALAAHPSNAPLRFAVARLLLQGGSEEGLKLLEPLFDAPSDAVAPAHRMACEFFRARGQVSEAGQHLLLALERKKDASEKAERDA